jgi:hypothetical protein
MEDMLVSGDRELNEWTLLRDQFCALMGEGSDDIQEILDVHFRRRFSELIDRVAARKNPSASEAQ